jgi:monoamine oxidase
MCVAAFVHFLPWQYIDCQQELMEPENAVFIAGEAVSWCHGWIQGAAESGARTSYDVSVSESGLALRAV